MNRWACVARLGGLGDNLIAASVLRPLKRMGYMCEVIAGEPNHVVYLNNPFVDKLSIKNADKDLPKNDLPAWQNWFKSRAAEYDVFAHLSHSCEGRHALFNTMTAFWWPPEYRRKLCAGNYLETVHDIARVPYEFGPLFFPTEEEQNRARETKSKVGDKCIGWVLSGTRIDKVYPYLAMAIGRVIRELDIPVVMLGAATDKQFAMAKTIQEHVQRQNGTDKDLHSAMSVNGAQPGGDQHWPVRRSLSFAHACDLIVSPDTGIAWACAFETMPKVMMISHTSVENITKHWINTLTLHADPNRVPCWPCHRLHDSPDTCVQNKDENGAACISDISVETLMESISKMWNQRNVLQFRPSSSVEIGRVA